MAKIQRTQQKIFGGNAPADDIAVLGSFKTGTPLYTDNIETLQNSAYEEGYGAAIVANEAPFMEEQNSIPYILSKQLAYNFQEGIAEYDVNTTYYIGSIVKVLDEENKPQLYYSLTDENTSNPVTDTENWQLLALGGGGSTSGGYNLFDLVKKDYILDFEESQGLSLLGTYVYKTGISGTRNGYSEFVQRCIDEMKAGEDYLITGDNITLPTFTANTTNGITISDARGNTTKLQKLFNNGLTKTGGVTRIGSWATYWISIDYGKPTYLKSYTICSDNVSPTGYPSAWTIQGSNDGVNFDVLGTYTDKTFTNNYSFKYVEGISYHQTKPYSQYRLVFSAGVESSGNGDLGWVAFDAQEVAKGKKNANGHIFYDIADKAIIDSIYESNGKAYFFGVDEENERIFLPRKDAVSFTPKDKLKVYGDGNALPFDTGEDGLNYLGTSNSYNNSKPLYLSNKVEGKVVKNGTISISTSTAHGGDKKAYALATESRVKAVGASSGMVSESFANYADDIFYVYMVVGNTSEVTHVSTTIPEGEALNQIYKNKDDILNKLDLDGSNAEFPYITETYVNGYSGYNIYSNGYCEQWGYTVLGAQNTMTGIKLLKKYRDSNYNALASNSGANTTYFNVKIGDTSTNTPDTLFISASSASTGVRWHTWGYLA